jgi:hypothetical protein
MTSVPPPPIPSVDVARAEEFSGRNVESTSEDVVSRGHVQRPPVKGCHTAAVDTDQSLCESDSDVLIVDDETNENTESSDGGDHAPRASADPSYIYPERIARVTANIRKVVGADIIEARARSKALWNKARAATIKDMQRSIRARVANLCENDRSTPGNQSSVAKRARTSNAK